MSDELKSARGHRLVNLPNGTWSIHDLTMGETCHPAIGPVAEAEALYVRQLKFTERIKPAEEFVIWDVGFGAAANSLTLIQACERVDCRLRLVSFDNSVEMLRFGLQHKDKLPYLRGFEDALEKLAAEHKVGFTYKRAKVDWELHLGDFPTLVASAAAKRLARAQVILFDPYSPVKNPAMWTQPVFAAMLGLTDHERGCLMPTYSRSTMLRVTLLIAGWYVGRGLATGRKEETTMAANRLELLDVPLGREWLGRALRSGSAEPLWEPVYRQAALMPGTREELMQHPQFVH